jgi:beta-galactosidase
VRVAVSAAESSRNGRVFSILLLAGLCLAVAMPGPSQVTPSDLITISGSQFLRDGKPYQIISGSIHYPRVPREYWRDRLRKARALGLNTVETYVFWNVHEPQPGVFDFSGNKDIATFVRMAKEEGLNVILRPGPYVCAEWDAGGFPAWLFADDNIKVRTRDPLFLAAANRYLMRLGQELAPLQATHGGPIIAVQVENEYGTFGDDREYMKEIRKMIVNAGFGDSILFTSDTTQKMANDSLPDLLPTINFGQGKAERSYAKRFLAMLYLASTNWDFRFNQPQMTGEYWAGWWDGWGDDMHARTDPTIEAEEVRWMLRQGYSINMYVIHGGTNFGFMNGAQRGADSYLPIATTYDYDAALDEAGRPTRKFFMLRDVIEEHTGIKPPALPASLPIAPVPGFTLSESAPLWANLPAPVRSERPRPMEAFGENYGYILYRKQLTGPVAGELVLDDLRYYAAVYVNQKLQGTIDRRLQPKPFHLAIPAGPVTLDILVENTGRPNTGDYLQQGQAGITRSVRLGDRELSGWQVYALPMTSPDQLSGWKTATIAGPAFHRGTFTLDSVADTFLDTTSLGKGFVWVNGHNLGRTWDVGPQRSLFVPAPWLRKGLNEVVAFDFTDVGTPELRGVTDPIWSKKLPPQQRSSIKDSSIKDGSLKDGSLKTGSLVAATH